jgi:hypothetical protein
MAGFSSLFQDEETGTSQFLESVTLLKNRWWSLSQSHYTSHKKTVQLNKGRGRRTGGTGGCDKHPKYLSDKIKETLPQR